MTILPVPTRHRPRASSAIRATLLAAALAAACQAGAGAAPSEVALPGDRAFPESITSTADGTLFVGSIAEGGILRAAPGAAAARPWIEPGANDSRSTFGVLADEGSGTLWACSNDVSGLGIPGPGTATGSALVAFDLRTGAGKGRTPLPGDRAFCNDVAIGPDGAAYVTDSLNPRILRLRPGAGEFEVWATDDRFASRAGGAGLDGIAFGGDGALYVDTFTPGGLFRVEVRDGAAGPVTALKPSRPLTLPDGLRRYGADTFLMAEGGGTLDLVTVAGDEARVETLAGGLAGPVSVTRVGDAAWVAEGQLKYVFDPKLRGEKPSLPFRLRAVPLAAAAR